MLNQRTMMTHVSFIGECNRMHPCGSRLCYGKRVCVEQCACADKVEWGHERGEQL